MYEAFEDHYRFYLVTELCQGGELLAEVLTKGRLDEKVAATIM